MANTKVARKNGDFIKAKDELPALPTPKRNDENVRNT